VQTLFVPAKDPTYVPYGHFKDIKTILESNAFYPIFLSGVSGNGKTLMVEQVCATLERKMVRVPISIETDEDDLIGGNTLIDGNVVFREGPVLAAMRQGAILNLDEIDRGSNKLMCLQSVLEGKPYYNKKTGEVIHPAKGFNIIATGNTKGYGSDTGKYITVQILDDAFLERFAVTFEQEFATSATEKKIILKKMDQYGHTDDVFAELLVKWANTIRATHKDGGCEDIISTRRLVHIVAAYAMFPDRLKAIELCVSRFDTDTQTVFMDLYTKLDASVTQEKAEVSEPDATFVNSSTVEITAERILEQEK